MRLRLRRRFADVVATQLELFERAHADLIEECAAAERAYDAADRDEAEERYGAYLDLVESGTEILVDMRSRYSAQLDEITAEAYEGVFNRAVAKRFPRFALELE